VFALLKRLASALIPVGYSLGEFSVDAKAAFVEAAIDHITQRGDRPSDARIAIVTGLSRAEVGKIRSRTKAFVPALNTHRAERVMHGWFTDERFVNADGTPRPLLLRGTNSFATLVQDYSGDIPYRALLNELVAGGMVHKTESRYIEPLRRHYMTSLQKPDAELELLSIDATMMLAGNIHESQTSIRRLAVEFSAPLPTSVIRNVNLRIERFLDALSDYLHVNARKAGENKMAADNGDTCFRIMVAHRELPIQKDESDRENHAG
jgi:hypothetical protein